MKKSSINITLFLILSFFVPSKAPFYSDYQNEDNAIAFLERLIELSQSSNSDTKQEAKELLELLLKYSMNAECNYPPVHKKIRTALFGSGFIHPGNGLVSPTFKEITWYLKKDAYNLNFYFDKSAFDRYKRRREKKDAIDEIDELNPEAPLTICTIL